MVPRQIADWPVRPNPERYRAFGRSTINDARFEEHVLARLQQPFLFKGVLVFRPQVRGYAALRCNPR
jgi:hypothetical protein